MCLDADNGQCDGSLIHDRAFEHSIMRGELGGDHAAGGSGRRALQETQVPDVDEHGQRLIAAIILMKIDVERYAARGMEAVATAGAPPALRIELKRVFARARGVNRS